MDKTFKRFGRRYKDLIEGREDAFYAICLDSVVEKAERGDVAAIEWRKAWIREIPPRLSQ